MLIYIDFNFKLVLVIICVHLGLIGYRLVYCATGISQEQRVKHK